MASSLAKQGSMAICKRPVISRFCAASLRIPRDQRRSVSAYGYTQAKALVYSQYGEPKDVLSLHGHSISPPTSTNITLRLLATPINPADVNQIQGVYPSKPPMTSVLGTPSPSAVGGNEGVAEVIAVGGSVKTVSKGDWVIMKSTGMGTWRTHMQLDESQVVKIDDKSNLTPLQVGTVSVNPVTAYRMLLDYTKWDFGASPQWFIQNAANSGVGRAAIQLGREWGLKSINVIRERPGWESLKQELEDLGATKVITEDQLLNNSKDVTAQIKEWTHGGLEPIQLGLNAVGGKSATALAKLLAPKSKMVTYGGMSKQPVLLPTGLLIFKEIGFEGFWVSKWSDTNPVQKKQTVDDVLRLTRMGKFKDVPFEEIKWDSDTKVETLRDAVQGTLQGFRKGKGVFVFGDT